MGRWGGKSGSEVTTPGPEPPLLALTAGGHAHRGLNPCALTPGLNARLKGGEGNLFSLSPLEGQGTLALKMPMEHVCSARMPIPPCS